MDAREQLNEFVRTHGTAPQKLIESISSNDDIRVVAFGENHWWNNPQRRFCAESLQVLSKAGFSHLALEMEPCYQETLDWFSQGIIGLEETENALRDAAASYVNSDDAFCPALSELMMAARALGFKLHAIDKSRDDCHWFHREYALIPRDRHMVSVIENILRDDSARVIVFSGNSHLYTRADYERFEIFSMAEGIRQISSLFSIGAVLPAVTAVSSLTFQNLYSIASEADKPIAIETEGTPFERFLVGEERRCAWGSCIAEGKNECPGISFHICEKIEKAPIFAGYWDALVFYGQRWREA